MLSRNVRTLFVALLSSAALFGCGKQERVELTASATAEATGDGAISVRGSTPKEIARLQEDIAKREAIDMRYPGSETPWGTPTERVTAITIPGILELKDGRKVRIDGIQCNEEAVGYLHRVLQREGVSVAILPSDGNKSDLIPAEVWSVDSDFKSEHLTASASYSNITEGAITSQWCKVEATPTCKHNARYAALAEAFSGAAIAR